MDPRQFDARVVADWMEENGGTGVDIVNFISPLLETYVTSALEHIDRAIDRLRDAHGDDWHLNLVDIPMVWAMSRYRTSISGFPYRVEMWVANIGSTTREEPGDPSNGLRARAQLSRIFRDVRHTIDAIETHAHDGAGENFEDDFNDAVAICEALESFNKLVSELIELASLYQDGMESRRSLTLSYQATHG